jgi:hypothetical protein
MGAKLIVRLQNTILDPQTFAKVHARIARRTLADVEARQGVHPYFVVVDGRKGASEDDVKPYGLIQYYIDVTAKIGKAIDAVYVALVTLAPVDTGQYQSRIWLLINGGQRDANLEQQDIGLNSGDVVQFIDTVPYARALEGGHSAQAPDGVFEVTLFAMKARFPDELAGASFSYVPSGDHPYGCPCITISVP